MMEILGPALGGFGVGLVGAKVTATRWAKDAKDSSEEALRLLKGSEQIDGDRVIEIVEENRTISRANRRAIERAESVPDPSRWED